MPPRAWRLRVEDILESIRTIQEFTSGITFDKYRRDRRIKLAVERCFEIIGEAARHVPPEITARHPNVPWKRMTEMRNVISHVYFKVSDRVVWDTLQHDLPPILPRLEKLLEQEKESGGAAD